MHGDAESFALEAGGADPLGTTYCSLMVQGKIPNVVPDASADGRVSGLEVTASARIGSYGRVPLRYSDGTLYGTFCCLGHDAEPHLDERDAAFLTMLAELLTEVRSLLVEQRQQVGDVLAGVRDELGVSIGLPSHLR